MDIVSNVPDFGTGEVSKTGLRVLSGIEKASLRERLHCDDAELKFMLRYVRFDLMQDELNRRQQAAQDIVDALRERTRSIPSRMEYDEMMSLINDVREIVKIGGASNGN